MIKLTIAIPTYNRPKQIINLLERFIDYRIEYSKQIIFDIIILDNSDNNITLQDFNDKISIKYDWIKYYKNDKNLGFDLNILNCYLNATGEYIWLFGDDDIPEYNCFDFIKIALSNKPSLLLLPFRQPLSLKTPQYNENQIFNQLECVKTITINTKITSFIIKNVTINHQSLLKYNNTGWMHLIISFEVLSNIGNHVQTLNQFCARPISDSDIKSLDWVPSAFINFDKLLTHPYLKDVKNNIDILKIWNDNYLSGLTLTCWGSSGAWNTRSVSKSDYIKFGKNYPFKTVLFLKPRYFLYWILVRLNFTKYFLNHFYNLSKKSGYEH